MPLVPPHGGAGLKPLALSGEALAAATARAKTLPALRISSRDWRSSADDFRRALTLNPNYASAHHWYSYYLRFANRLEGRFGIAVTLVDERLTSVAAESRLREAGVRGDRIKAGLDAAAAREILAAYF